MLSITVRMLGSCAVCLKGADLLPNLNRCTAGLLAYLAWRAGKVTSRDRLAEDLWHKLPASRAARALNTAVWRLRRVLTGLGIDPDVLIVSRPEGIGLNPDISRDSDVEALEALAQRVRATRVADADDELVRAVAEAESLYGGEFLPGRHDDWCVLPREALRGQLEALTQFSVRACMQHGDWRGAIDQAQHLLNRDPLQEQVHQWLITCYLRVGDRLRAKAQFTRCAELLRCELGVEPLVETAALIESIPARANTVTAHGAESSPTIRRVLKNLDDARETLVSLDRQLSRTARTS